MERLRRILRLAILRGDRAAELIIRAKMGPTLSESEMRLMDGNR